MSGWWILPSVVLGTALWIALFVLLSGHPLDAANSSDLPLQGARHA